MIQHKFKEEVTIKRDKYILFSYKDLEMLEDMCLHHKIKYEIVEVEINPLFKDRWLFVVSYEYYKLEKVYKELCEQI